MLLEKNHSPENPFNIISLDTEDFDGETYIWVVTGNFRGKRICRRFTEPQPVVRYLFHRRWPHTYLTGKNLDYDLNTLKYRKGFDWNCIYNMGQLITASPSLEQRKKYNLQNKQLKILELGNWVLNKSLKEMSKDFEVAGHIDKHVLHRDGNYEEMCTACESHCDTAVQILEKIQTAVHAVGGRLKITAASSAMDLFQNSHVANHQIYDFKLGPSSKIKYQGIQGDELMTYLNEKGGLARVGGRTEIFQRGIHGNTSCIDRISSYPAEMLELDLPDMNAFSPAVPNIKTLPKIMKKLEGCALVELEAPNNFSIPLVHQKMGGRLIFPTGSLTGWFTFLLLRKALEVGYKLISVLEVLPFRPVKNFFKTYIEATYQMKLDKNTKAVGKLYMNGLSGKFGQRKPDDSGFLLYTGSDPATIDNKQFFLFGELTYEYIHTDKTAPIEYAATAYPLIAAYILDGARIALWETIQAVGESNVWYSDTDSVHGDSTAIEAAIKRGDINVSDEKLGCWKYEYQNGTFEGRGLKYYRFKPGGTDSWNYHIKGVPASKQRQYWADKSMWSTRVRKFATAIRTSKKVNEFHSVYRHDLPATDKRIFKNRTSLPIVIG